MTFPGGLLDPGVQFAQQNPLAGLGPTATPFAHMLPAMQSTAQRSQSPLDLAHALAVMRSTARGGQQMPPLAMTPQGIPSAGPHAATLPPQSAAQKQSLWQRVQNILMPQQGAASLLDEEGLGSARKQGLLADGFYMLAHSRGHNGGNAPGFGEALAGGVEAGQNAFQGAAQNQVQGDLAAQQIGEQHRILQARGAIAQKYPPQPNETPRQTIDRLRSMYSDYVRAGDTEMATKLGEVVGKIGEDPLLTAMKNYKEPIQLDLGGKKVMIDPFTMKPVASFDKTAAPVDPATTAYRDQAAKDRESTAAFGHEDRLYSDYTKDAAPGQAAAHAYQNVQNFSQSALAGNGQAQQAFVAAYIKLMHPTAVVRPSEIVRYEDGAPVDQKIQAMWQHITTGGKLAPQQIQAMIDGSKGVAQEWQRDSKQRIQDFTTRATRWKVDPSIFTDPWANFGAPATETAPKGSAGNVRQFLKR
jgi:hypothetical protein